MLLCGNGLNVIYYKGDYDITGDNPLIPIRCCDWVSQMPCTGRWKPQTHNTYLSVGYKYYLLTATL